MSASTVPAAVPEPTNTPGATEPNTPAQGLLASMLAPVDPARTAFSLTPQAAANGATNTTSDTTVTGVSSDAYHGDDTPKSTDNSGSGNGNGKPPQGVIRAWLLAGAERWKKGAGVNVKRLEVKAAQARAHQVKETRSTTNQAPAPLGKTNGGGAAGKPGSGSGAGAGAGKGLGSKSTESGGGTAKGPKNRSSDTRSNGAGKNSSNGSGGRTAPGSGGGRGGTPAPTKTETPKPAPKNPKRPNTPKPKKDTPPKNPSNTTSKGDTDTTPPKIQAKGKDNTNTPGSPASGSKGATGSSGKGGAAGTSGKSGTPDGAKDTNGKNTSPKGAGPGGTPAAPHSKGNKPSLLKRLQDKNTKPGAPAGKGTEDSKATEKPATDPKDDTAPQAPAAPAKGKTTPDTGTKVDTRKSRETGYRDGTRGALAAAHIKAYKDGVRDGWTDTTEAADRNKARLDQAHTDRKTSRKDPSVNAPASSADYQQSTGPQPIPVAGVTPTHVLLGPGANRASLSRGEVRSLKGFERRLQAQADAMSKRAEQTKGMKAHADQQVQQAAQLLEQARGAKGGDRLVGKLTKLQEAAQSQAGKAEEIHKRALRAADTARTVLTNTETRYGAMYQAVVDSPETAPAELDFYKG